MLETVIISRIILSLHHGLWEVREYTSDELEKTFFAILKMRKEEKMHESTVYQKAVEKSKFLSFMLNC